MARKTNKTNTTNAAEKTANATAKVSKKIQRERDRAAALKSMRPLAATINRKIKSVQNMEGKIDDARLAACVALSEAYQIASETAGIRFKAWCEESVTVLGYEALRKMRPIGDAERETEGAGLAMLQDARQRSATASRKNRENGGASGGESGGGGGEGTGAENGNGTRPTDLAASIREIFLRLSDDAQIEFAAWVESHIGAHDLNDAA